MPLVQSSLQSALEGQWLPADDGPFPASASESGDKFAGAVASWFSSAMGAGQPCSTADARKSGLASLAASAFQASDAMAAGSLLETALATYMTGQMFGDALAAAPAALGSAGPMLGATFADLSASRSDRAQRIASACTLLAVSTLVTSLSTGVTTPVS